MIEHPGLIAIDSAIYRLVIHSSQYPFEIKATICRAYHKKDA